MAMFSSGNTWIKVDASQVRSMIKKAVLSLGRTSISLWLNQHVNPYMLNSFKKNFNESKSPDGTSWKPLAKQTRENRKALGYGAANPKLRREYYLHRLVTTTAGNIKEAGYGMNWGKSITQIRYLANQKPDKNKATTPARPMIGFRKENKPYILKDLRDWVMKNVRT